MKFKNISQILLSSSLIFSISCGETKSDSSEDDKDATAKGENDTGGTDQKSGANIAKAENVGDLKLSQAFAFNLPGALALDLGASLNLTAGKKSQEACHLGQEINEVARSLEEVGGFFCHIEIEKDKILFGKKTRIVTNGQEFAKIWLDNSVEGKIRIGMCQNGENKHSQIIEVNGLSDDGPKGTIINKGEYTDTDDEDNEISGTFHRSVTFDMSVADTVSINASERSTQGDNDVYNRFIDLQLLEEGISQAILASKGSRFAENFSQRGKALFNGEFGAAVFENNGVHENQAYSFSRKAYFDEPGDVAASDASPEFAEGGSLNLSAADLPTYLADDFTPTELDGWVADGCPDHDVEAVLDPESEAHQQCDGDDQNNWKNCWDENTFEQGDDL